VGEGVKGRGEMMDGGEKEGGEVMEEGEDV
jgi:hypothetical protein